MSGHAASRSLKAVAIFELCKGLLVLIAGTALLRFVHHDAEHAVDSLVRIFHLDPAHAHPNIFERLLHHINDGNLRLLALGALAYAVIRIVEAWGLWHERRWAEWLAVLSGAIYVPFEIREIVHTRGAWPAVVLFLVNAFIVVFLAVQLRKRSPVASPEPQVMAHQTP